jgi:NifU-like protein involved in Fe-S cluster formation
MIADARFTADACARFAASASLLTERARDAVRRGARRGRAMAVRVARGEPPAARRKRATLPPTLHRAAANLHSAAQ